MDREALGVAKMPVASPIMEPFGRPTAGHLTVPRHFQWPAISSSHEAPFATQAKGHSRQLWYSAAARGKITKFTRGQSRRCAPHSGTLNQPILPSPELNERDPADSTSCNNASVTSTVSEITDLNGKRALAAATSLSSNLHISAIGTWKSLPPMTMNVFLP